MTDIDLIVLIPWAVVSVAFILLCIRLQISSSRARSQCPKCRAGQAREPGMKPADDPDPVPHDAGATHNRNRGKAALSRRFETPTPGCSSCRLPLPAP
jgi:hypothetical protein